MATSNSISQVWRALTLGLALALFAPFAVGQEAHSPKPVDLAGRLRRAMELDRPSERRSAALELARDHSVELEDWRAAIEPALRREPVEPGEQREILQLWVGGGMLEETQVEVFVPSSYDETTPTPLLVVFHGTGGSGNGMTRTWRGVAEAMGMIVLAPSDAGANRGYTFTERERQSSLSAIRWARLHYSIDPNRIHLTGISRGGHLTWDLGLRYPDRFASLAPMVGSPRLELTEGRNNLRYIENVANIPIRDLQGEGDDALMLVNLRLTFERLRSFKAKDARLITFPNLGHDMDMNAVDWRTFFSESKRDPNPKRVVLCAARPSATRSNWVEILKLDKDVEEVFRPRITAKRYNSLSPDKRQALVEKLVDAKTARIEIERTAAGRFKAKEHGVASYRLLLTEDMLAAGGKIIVRTGSRSKRAKLHPDTSVFLTEFVERMDPGFLPVAQITVGG